MLIAIIILLVALIVSLYLYWAQLRKSRQLETDKQEQSERLSRLEDEVVELGQLARLGKQTAQIIHEFNTPLAGIKTNLQITADAQRSEVKAWLDFAPHSSPELLANMVALVYSTYNEQMKSHSRAERKAGEARLVAFFDDDFLIDAFSFFRVYDDLDRFKTIYTHEHYKLAIELVSFIIERVQAILVSVRSVNNLEKIIHSLKDYSYGGQSNGAETKKGELDIERTIETSLALFSADLKAMVVDKDYDQLPTIMGYPRKLSQVWTNVISNAIYASKGKGTLNIRIRNRTDVAIIEIEDEGGGIEESMLTSIFKDFTTTKPQGEGTGLGLGISQKIVKEHGGEMMAVNGEKGAIFRVKLPLL